MYCDTLFFLTVAAVQFPTYHGQMKTASEYPKGTVVIFACNIDDSGDSTAVEIYNMYVNVYIYSVLYI